ncbi:hypothetical protein RCG24_20540 [Neobacillus sp. OS1-32]|nr:hypothetical protein [Neobacillus sp. OS1-32]WML30238.1 hypothetical protein RCG24_20540 [Neobacillus sp. OS1-32]
MFTYQRSRILPRVLAQVAEEQRKVERQEPKVDVEELAEWL